MWNKLNHFRRLLRVSVWKTLFFNFHMLPFSQAVKLPIILTRNTYFYNLSGIVKIKGDVKFGMIRFGFMGEDTNVWKNDRALINISGSIIFKGSVRFGVGVSLRVENFGTLQMGNNILMNYKTKLICYDSIIIEDDCNIAWDVQILDTDLHFMRNTLNNTVSSRTAPVKIGRSNWIGNSVSIQKGAHTADYCIIASGSIVNSKSISCENSIIAGSPAKIVKNNYTYILCEEEAAVISSFNYK